MDLTRNSLEFYETEDLSRRSTTACHWSLPRSRWI